MHDVELWGWGLHDAAFGVAVVDRGVVPQSAESKLVVHREVLCAHSRQGGRGNEARVDLLAREAPPQTSLKPRPRLIWAGAGRVVGGGRRQPSAAAPAAPWRRGGEQAPWSATPSALHPLAKKERFHPRLTVPRKWSPAKMAGLIKIRPACLPIGDPCLLA